MKIKCPFNCDDEDGNTEFNMPYELARHFQDIHNELSINMRLAKFYFKIHEKIEEVQHSLEYNRDVKKYDVDYEEWTLEKLKSLLECE